MKANKLIELTLAAIMLIFAACSGGDDNGGSNSGGNTDPKSSVNITTSSPTVPQTGASTTVSFVVSGSWTASSNQSWCHVSPTSGNQGTTTITVTCDDNDTYDERNATVTIKCGNASSSITVTQKQKDALLVTSNKIEIEAAGGEATIEVKANVDYDYTVEESAKSWISIGGTRALTTKNIILNIAENEEQTPREGKITISSSDFKEEVTVYQQGAVPSIVLTTKEFTVASSGETIKVELKSNTNYTIQMPNVKWITESSTRAMSSYTHYFKVEENTSYDSRSAGIIFKDESNGIEEKVTVNQLQKDAIVLAQSSYTVDYKATQLDFSVKSNVELEVTTSDTWIKQVSTRALTEKKLYFDIEENTSETSRTGYIYITSGDLKQTITVTQKAQMTDPPYLTFTADDEQTLQMSKAVYSFEYSVNDGEWEVLATTKVTFGGTNGNLRLRGKSAQGTYLGGSSGNDSSHARISFGNSTPVACSGDIRTLIDFDKYNKADTSIATFRSLFSGCTSLTQAPELPATILASSCYQGMFSGCTSLTQAPELPATTLAINCYQGMFRGCTSLTQAPELPATTLAYECYQDMFSGCTSLTQAPELPATTLASSCYQGMFYGCTSLTQAPELPATSLAERCYCYMFYGCENLYYIKVLATDILDRYFDGWVVRVASTGIFVSNSAAISDWFIPKGWLVIYYNTDSNKYYLDKECTKECDDHGNSL